jgi:hypothetical protein
MQSSANFIKETLRSPRISSLQALREIILHSTRKRYLCKSKMKKFDIPEFYRSSIIGAIKEARKSSDPRKKDFKPTVLDFGPVQF